MHDTDPATPTQARGRPRGPRPRTSAQRMREARERLDAAVHGPGDAIDTLPDGLLAEAAGVAFRSNLAFTVYRAAQAMIARIHARHPAAHPFTLSLDDGTRTRHDATVTEIIDTVTEKKSTVTEKTTYSDAARRYAVRMAGDGYPPDVVRAMLIGLDGRAPSQKHYQATIRRWRDAI